MPTPTTSRIAHKITLRIAAVIAYIFAADNTPTFFSCTILLSLELSGTSVPAFLCVPQCPLWFEAIETASREAISRLHPHPSRRTPFSCSASPDAEHSFLPRLPSRSYSVVKYLHRATPEDVSSKPLPQPRLVVYRSRPKAR